MWNELLTSDRYVVWNEVEGGKTRDLWLNHVGWGWNVMYELNDFPKLALENV